MCGRYTLHQKTADLAKRYNLATIPDSISKNFNVAPGHVMPVILGSESGKPAIELMKWGLIPFWAKDPRIGYKMINARSETIFEKPAWRSVIKKKRCLIPADGFYEWKKQSDAKVKQPFYIHPKQFELFSFAGVWESWKDENDNEIRTYSIITTEPNKEMSSIHDRMPVILYPEDEASWIEPSNSDQSTLERLLYPYEDNGLEIYEVDRAVNATTNNNNRLFLPLGSQ